MIEATLVKRKTDDELLEISDRIKLGTKYLIDPASERVWEGFNLEKKKGWTRRMVRVANGAWFPSELLEWPGKPIVS